MSDYAQILADNLARLRRKRGFTQSALAQKLCVSFQAISKWENKLSSPDILLLPKIADTFGVSIDELFGKKKVLNIKGAHSDLFSKNNWVSLPWENDDSIHAAVFEGHKLIEDFKSASKFTLELSGKALNVDCRCNITCENISGNASAGGSIECHDIEGNTSAGGSVICNNVGKNAAAGGSLTCDKVGENASAGGSLNCDSVGGTISAGGNLRCDDIGGDAHAGGDIECSNIFGNATSENGNIYCQSVSGEAQENGNKK